MVFKKSLIDNKSFQIFWTLQCILADTYGVVLNCYWKTFCLILEISLSYSRHYHYVCNLNCVSLEISIKLFSFSLLFLRFCCFPLCNYIANDVIIIFPSILQFSPRVLVLIQLNSPHDWWDFSSYFFIRHIQSVYISSFRWKPLGLVINFILFGTFICAPPLSNLKRLLCFL